MVSKYYPLKPVLLETTKLLLFAFALKSVCFYNSNFFLPNPTDFVFLSIACRKYRTPSSRTWNANTANAGLLVVQCTSYRRVTVCVVVAKPSPSNSTDTPRTRHWPATSIIPVSITRDTVLSFYRGTFVWNTKRTARTRAFVVHCARIHLWYLRRRRNWMLAKVKMSINSKNSRYVIYLCSGSHNTPH